MDTSIENIPQEYFDVTRGKLEMSRNRRKSKKKHSKTLKQKKDTESDLKRAKHIMFLFSAIILLLVVAILVLVVYRHFIVDSPINCPKEYYGDDCRRNDYLDMLSWTGVNSTCLIGCSFRTWAYGVKRVLLFLRSPSETEYKSYHMINEGNGYWYYQICNCVENSVYHYFVDSNEGGEYILSMGGTECNELSGSNVANILKFYDYDESYTHYVKLDAYPIVYHIHVPSYRIQTLSTRPYALIQQKLRTLQYEGFNVIELNSIENLVCGTNTYCWDESSYSPGLLNPLNGDSKDLISMIETAHALGMQVIVDLDWEGFRDNTLVYKLHEYYSRAEKEGTIDIEDDIIRGVKYSSSDRKPLNLKSSTAAITLLRNVLRRYRFIFHMDSVRWITRYCSSYIGGDCSGKKRDNDENIVILKDIYNDLKAGNINMITDNKDSIPAYDYFIDKTICQMYNTISKTNAVTHSFLIQLLSIPLTASSTTIFPMQCYDSVTSRLVSRGVYEVSIMLTALFYFLPIPLQVFMGDDWMSRQSFGSSPSVLDLEKQSEWSGTEWGKGDGLYKQYLTRDALFLHSSLYATLPLPVTMVHDDETRSIIIFFINSGTKRTIISVNYGAGKFVDSNAYSFNTTMMLFNQNQVARLFTSHNSRYDSIYNGDTYTGPIMRRSLSSCPANKYCYYLDIASYSTDVFAYDM